MPEEIAISRVDWTVCVRAGLSRLCGRHEWSCGRLDSKSSFTSFTFLTLESQTRRNQGRRRGEERAKIS